MTTECPTCGGTHTLPQDPGGRYWVSWWSDQDPDDIPWPVWISGQRFAPPMFSVCAVIDAASEADVWHQVRERYTDAEQRFIAKRPDDWRPAADRFPQPE